MSTYMSSEPRVTVLTSAFFNVDFYLEIWGKNKISQKARRIVAFWPKCDVESLKIAF